MDHNLKLTESEKINTPASAVWKALTDKEMIKQYFFGTEVESEWKKGSPVTFSGSWKGQRYLDKGTILEIQVEKLLKFSYWSSMSGLDDTPENYAIVTYRLETEGSYTLLTVTQEGFKDLEAYDHSKHGWKEVLKNLRFMLEK